MKNAKPISIPRANQSLPVQTLIVLLLAHALLRRRHQVCRIRATRASPTMLISQRWILTAGYVHDGVCLDQNINIDRHINLERRDLLRLKLRHGVEILDPVFSVEFDPGVFEEEVSNSTEVFALAFSAEAERGHECLVGEWIHARCYAVDVVREGDGVSLGGWGFFLAEDAA